MSDGWTPYLDPGERIPWAGGAPFFFGLSGLPFLVIGIFMIIGRLLHDQIRRNGTVCALGTKRAFIAQAAFGRRPKEKTITRTTSFADKPGDLATLTFDPQGTGVFDNARSFGVWSGDTGHFAFAECPDDAQAYRIMRDIQRGKE